jgi:hypothetical protein
MRNQLTSVEVGSKAVTRETEAVIISLGASS